MDRNKPEARLRFLITTKKPTRPRWKCKFLFYNSHHQKKLVRANLSLTPKWQFTCKKSCKTVQLYYWLCYSIIANIIFMKTTNDYFHCRLFTWLFSKKYQKMVKNAAEMSISLLIHLPIIFWINQLIFWSRKCQEQSENAILVFPRWLSKNPKLNIFGLQWYITEKLQIRTIKKLEVGNVWKSWLMNDDESIIRIVDWNFSLWICTNWSWNIKTATNIQKPFSRIMKASVVTVLFLS